ncbi:P-loop containing nucleoside triphosphate hydrolase protein [Hypoxylon sp. NC1633]|nr:P-loop containing nucleoside triphosphate hydrolase protein [Hypoxylon sp. NC1633]
MESINVSRPSSHQDAHMEMNDTTPVIRVPIAKTFSFAVPDCWKPANSFLVGWVEGLPGPVEREQPLVPARIQAPKRTLDSVDTDDGHDNDDHRNKRTKMGSSLGLHPGLEARRNAIAKSSHGIMDRVSNACRRIVNRSKHEESPKGPKASEPRVSLTLPGTPPIIADRTRMRFVFVGDSGCGKSSFLLRYHLNIFNTIHVKTQYELFNKTVNVDGRDVDLELWDTSGDFGLHQLQRLSYLSWDAVFLCFSIDTPMRLANLQMRWIDEIRNYCPNAPVILLGLKKDTRIGSGLWAPMYPQMQARISATEGSSSANIMRAVKYIECSAKTGENVNRVFNEGIKLVLGDRSEGNDPEQVQQKPQKRGTKKNGSDFARFMCFK